MLRTNAKLKPPRISSRQELKSEYISKLDYYDIVEKDLEKYFEFQISKLITVPFDDHKLTIEVEGIDDEDDIKYLNLFGHTKSNFFSSKHVELSNVVVIDREIIVFDKLMRVVESDGTTFDKIDYTLDFEAIDNICVSVLNYYLCNKVVCNGYDDLLLKGDVKLVD